MSIQACTEYYYIFFTSCQSNKFKVDSPASPLYVNVDYIFFTPSQTNKLKVDSPAPIPSICEYYYGIFFTPMSRVNLKSTLARLQPLSHLNVNGKECITTYMLQEQQKKKTQSVDCILHP